jgi:hypothetical protein
VNSVRCPVPGCRDHLDVGQARELTGSPICDPCRSRARRALSKLPVAYVELRTSAAGGPAGEYVTGTSEPGEPVNVEHRALATHLRNRLVCWEDIARELRGLAARPRIVREGWAVGHAVDLLEAHGDALWAHPAYGPPAASDLLRLHRRASTVLGHTAVRQHLTPPCPHCEMRSLVRDQGAGSDYVRCINCQAHWDDTEYQRLVRVLLDAAGATP